MVAGKPTNPTALSTTAKTLSNPRLPPLPRLRVRKPNSNEANPCIGMLSSVLGCWASQGYSAQGCAMLEQQLRVCMDAKKATTAKKSDINHQLSRFYPQMKGPHKRK